MTQSVSKTAPIIAVVGSVMMDLTCYADKLPEAGETSIGQLFTTGFGGKGANQGVMARRCGAEVYMVGSVGGDLFGDSIAANFANEGLNTSFLQISDVATGVAHIWVDGSGENRIIIVPGANHDIDAAIAAKAISEIKDLKIVIAQCEINQEVTLAAFRVARVRGCLTLLNPAPFQTLSTELLALTDWLIPNEIEFAQIHPNHSYPNSDAAIASLRKGQFAVVTLGAEGAALVDPSGKVERFRTPKVHVVDSTGAGDGFIGAFAAALALGISPEMAVQFGCEVASFSVTMKGAQSSYPEPDEIAVIFDRIVS